MRTPRALISILTAGLLVVAAAVPASAGGEVGKATGHVKWTGQHGSGSERPGRTSIFRVRDGRPGTVSRKGDRGWYHFSERNVEYDQSLTMRVRCVRVEGNWAEFAGVITRATGNFNKGNVFLVSVVDLDDPQRLGHNIGMKSWGKDLKGACEDALDGSQFGRQGQVTGGWLNVTVR